MIVERLSNRRTCGAPAAPAPLPDEVYPSAGEMYQRDDDKPETIANRLDVYEKNTSPLVVLPRGRGRLDVVNGVGSGRRG